MSESTVTEKGSGCSCGCEEYDGGAGGCIFRVSVPMVVVQLGLFRVDRGSVCVASGNELKGVNGKSVNVRGVFVAHDMIRRAKKWRGAVRVCMFQEEKESSRKGRNVDLKVSEAEKGWW